MLPNRACQAQKVLMQGSVLKPAVIPMTLRPRRDGEDHPYHLQLPEQALCQEKRRTSNNQGLTHFPISGIRR